MQLFEIDSELENSQDVEVPLKVHVVIAEALH